MSKFAEFKPGPGETGSDFPPGSLSIRPGLESDLDEVAAISAEREGQSSARSRRHLERMLGAPGVERPALLLVASIPGELAGFGKAAYFVPPADAPPNAAPEGWYLSGVVVQPGFRRRGIGSKLTRARLAWIAERSEEAYYFANVRNEVSLVLHSRFGFVEVTRDFWFPGVEFEGGKGILFRCDLAEGTWNRSDL